MNAGPNDAGADLPETDVIRPSLLHNGFMALGCAIMAGAMFRAGAESIEGATYLGIFLSLGATMFLASHLPGCTGIWLDRDGFLVRDLYSSRRYEWNEVSIFDVRRKLLGRGIDFAYRPADADRPEARSLPRGVGGSVWTVAKKMNDWRARATGE